MKNLRNFAIALTLVLTIALITAVSAQAQPPGVTTLPATHVTATSAVLNGWESGLCLGAGCNPVIVQFTYKDTGEQFHYVPGGPSRDPYSTILTTVTAIPGRVTRSGLHESAVITGLMPCTTYQFTIEYAVEPPAGIGGFGGQGSAMTFTTQASRIHRHSPGKNACNLPKSGR